MKTQPRLLTLATLLGIACLGLRVNATPYASGVNYNPGTAVLTFVLNENATDVSIVTNSADGITGTYDLGVQTRGAHSVALGFGATNYSIVVSNISGPGWRAQSGTIANPTGGATVKQNVALQISDNLNSNVVLSSPRGLAINKNAASPNFGRVYVANSAASAIPFTNSNALLGTGGYRLNGVGDGLYVLNADLSDPFGAGTVRTAGLDTAFTNNTETPYRLFLGSDEKLYVCGKANTNSANLWMTDADVSPGSGTNLLAQMASQATATTTFPIGTANNHGSIESVWVSGSLATGNANFYMMDQDNQDNPTTTTATQRQSLWSNKNHSFADLPISSACNHILTPSWLSEMVSSANVGDFDRGSPNDQYYIVIYKSAGDTFRVYNNTFGGSGLYTSDGNQAGYCLSLAPDGTSYLAVGRRDDGMIWIYPLDASFLPRDTRRALLNTGLSGSGGTYRVWQVKFDAAYNLYVSQGSMPLRVFSPGGASLATTSGDTNSTTSSSFGVLFGPSITLQPTSTSLSIAVGVTNSTGFSCQGDYLTNVPAFSKQWFKVGSGALPNFDSLVVGSATVGHISAGQSASMAFTPLSCADSGDYFLVTANAIGATTSSIVHVTVTGDPSILVPGQPVSVTNMVGTTAQFSVIPTGTAPFGFQWKHAGTNLLNGATGSGSTIANSTTDTLSILNCSPSDATNGTYSVVVTNTSTCSSGITTSGARTLTVWLPPTMGSVTSLGGGSYELNFSGSIGQPYTLRYSTDISLPLDTPWTPLSSGVFGSDPVIFPDASADPQRFYIITSP